MLTDEEIAEVYRTARTFAIVGASSNPMRDSHTAVEYLKAQGYRVIPVNPKETDVEGEPARRSLSDVPEPVDVAVVFRRSEDAAEVAREAVARGAKVVWLPVGVTSQEARRTAEEGGAGYVEDRCVYTTHRLMSRAGMLS